MTNQELFDLISCFDRSTVQTLKLSTQDFTIELSRGNAPVQSACVPQFPAPAPSDAPKAGLSAVTAPLVGTFYLTPAPDQPPFVAVGDRVKKGQTLCLIEAMKTMSEIPAPCDCVIEEIVCTSGDLVAYGDALLRYRPC